MALLDKLVHEEDLDSEVMGADQQRFQEPLEAWENKASDSDGFAGRTLPSPEYVKPL